MANTAAAHSSGCSGSNSDSKRGRDHSRSTITAFFESEVAQLTADLRHIGKTTRVEQTPIWNLLHRTLAQAVHEARAQFVDAHLQTLKSDCSELSTQRQSLLHRLRGPKFGETQTAATGISSASGSSRNSTPTNRKQRSAFAFPPNSGYPLCQQVQHLRKSVRDLEQEVVQRKKDIQGVEQQFRALQAEVPSSSTLHAGVPRDPAQLFTQVDGEQAEAPIEDAYLQSLSKFVQQYESRIGQRREQVKDLVQYNAAKLHELSLEEQQPKDLTSLDLKVIHSEQILLKQDDPEQQGCGYNRDIVGDPLLGSLLDETLASLQTRGDQLTQQFKARHTTITELAKRIQALWSDLGVEQDRQVAFLTMHAGHGRDTIVACQAELSRLRAMRFQRIDSLIKQASGELRRFCEENKINEHHRWWVCCKTSDAVLSEMVVPFEQSSEKRSRDLNAADVTPDMDKEEVVVVKAYAAREAALRALQDAHREVRQRDSDLNAILVLVGEREQIMAEVVEHEKLSKDPNRFRIPGLLLKEERFRNAIRKTLPRVSKRLRRLIAQYEKSFGDFMYNSVKYTVAMDESERHETIQALKPKGEVKSVVASVLQVNQLQADASRKARLDAAKYGDGDSNISMTASSPSKAKKEKRKRPLHERPQSAARAPSNAVNGASASPVPTKDEGNATGSTVSSRVKTNKVHEQAKGEHRLRRKFTPLSTSNAKKKSRAGASQARQLATAANATELRATARAEKRKKRQEEQVTRAAEAEQIAISVRVAAARAAAEAAKAAATEAAARATAVAEAAEAEATARAAAVPLPSPEGKAREVASGNDFVIDKDSATPTSQSSAVVLEANVGCGSCAKRLAGADGIPVRKVWRCALCKAAFYCSAECQKSAWPQHKKQLCAHSRT